jgi:hypothetical protein
VARFRAYKPPKNRKLRPGIVIASVKRVPDGVLPPPPNPALIKLLKRAIEQHGSYEVRRALDTAEQEIQYPENRRGRPSTLSHDLEIANQVYALAETYRTAGKRKPVQSAISDLWEAADPSSRKAGFVKWEKRVQQQCYRAKRFWIDVVKPWNRLDKLRGSSNWIPKWVDRYISVDRP